MADVIAAFIAAGRVAPMQRAGRAGSEHALPVGTEDYHRHGALIARQFAKLAAGFGLIEPNDADAAADRDRLSVRSEGGAGGEALSDAPFLFAVSGVPKAHGGEGTFAPTDGEQGFAVR
jgi:hypothetical protein